MFKPTFSAVFAVVNVVALLASGQASAAVLTGGPTGYSLKADVIQCVTQNAVESDAIPEELLEPKAIQAHPACGILQARVLASIDMPLENGRTTLWNNLRNVVITGKHFVPELKKNGEFTFNLAEKPETTARVGVEVEAYLDASDRKKPELSLLVKHYSTDNTAEEIVSTSSGEVFLNPYPREVVRMVHIHTSVTPGHEDIWGGEGVYVGVAPVNIPHVFPENARLWVSGLVKK